MKFNSARVSTTFLNVKRNSTQLKDMVSHDEGELNANYPKMSRFTHNLREKIAMNLLRFTHKFGEKITINL